MHVKVVSGQSLDLYACDLVKGERSGQDTVLHLIRLEKGEVPRGVDAPDGEIIARKIAEIVLPRDGNIAYVENDKGGTIDTFRAGEDLPTGSRVMEIGQGAEGEGGGGEELSGGRTRVFRGLPRGVGPAATGQSERSVGPILPPPANRSRGES